MHKIEPGESSSFGFETEGSYPLLRVVIQSDYPVEFVLIDKVNHKKCFADEDCSFHVKSGMKTSHNSRVQLPHNGHWKVVVQCPKRKESKAATFTLDGIFYKAISCDRS